MKYVLPKVQMQLRRLGEIVTVCSDGVWSACPVCGYVTGGDLPYIGASPMGSGADAQRQFATPSFDICPCCRTQYGVDDWVDGVTVACQWEKLRQDWLNRVGWNEAALQQLHDGLGIRVSRNK